MTIDVPLSLFSGGAITVVMGIMTFLFWLAHRTIAHQGQIRHLEEKMDRGFKHLEDKIDSAIKNTNEKFDAAIRHMDEKLNRQDQEARARDSETKERISRLEKYFDVIMQTQIKKNPDQFSMESWQG